MGPIGALVRFARLVSTSKSTDEVMRVLADVAVQHLGIDAAGVLAVATHGPEAEDEAVELVAMNGLPESVRGWRAPADTIGDELAGALAEAAGGAFPFARALPLVSSVGLHGALVLLAAKEIELDTPRAQLASGLADLAGIAAGRITDYQQLARSYAELRASREALARTEKLRALGQMAAGVSHDLKNILNPLGLQLTLLRRRIDKGPREAVVETLDTMAETIRVGVDTVERLRDFSRQAPESEAERTELGKLVAQALDLVRPKLAQAEGITVKEELGATPPIVAHPSELVTAVVNLVINAIDAMPGGGTITVRTGLADGGGWIDVADDGPGMPPEVERHVFEPFFTTKGEHGTGLGLAMVYAFVQRHGGKVTLDTAPGRGTTFRLWFPPAT